MSKVQPGCFLLPHTIVEIYVPATFADEGTYTVSLDNRSAYITIKYVASQGYFAHVTGLNATQKLFPDDPSGIVNFSHIVIDFPYYLEEHEKVLSDDAFERSSAYYKKIDDLSLRYLNRLVDVVRYCTQRYWIRSIPLDLLHVHVIKEVDEDGGGRGISWIRVPSGSKVEWKMQNQSDVQGRVLDILKHEARLPISETLFLEALNYFYSSNIVQAVIVANTSLEVFVIDDIINSYMKQGKSRVEASTYVSKSYKKKFEPMFKKAYINGGGDASSHPILKKVVHVRNIRRQVIHPFIRTISADEAKEVLHEIREIIGWIKDQPTK